VPRKRHGGGAGHTAQLRPHQPARSIIPRPETTPAVAPLTQSLDIYTVPERGYIDGPVTGPTGTGEGSNPDIHHNQ
jgi:hypothetical protein